MISINKKDLTIMQNLRKNARVSLTRMSKETGIPVSTIFDRIKSQEGKLISKYTSLLDFEKLGYSTRAKLCIKVEREDKDELKEYLTRHQAVNSLFRINNGFDFMVEVVFRQIMDLEEFKDKLEDRFRIQECQSYYIIEDLKREEFLTDINLID